MSKKIKIITILISISLFGFANETKDKETKQGILNKDIIIQKDNGAVAIIDDTNIIYGSIQRKFTNGKPTLLIDWRTSGQKTIVGKSKIITNSGQNTIKKGTQIDIVGTFSSLSSLKKIQHRQIIQKY